MDHALLAIEFGIKHTYLKYLYRALFVSKMFGRAPRSMLHFIVVLEIPWNGNHVCDLSIHGCAAVLRVTYLWFCIVHRCVRFVLRVTDLWSYIVFYATY